MKTREIDLTWWEETNFEFNLVVKENKEPVNMTLYSNVRLFIGGVEVTPVTTAQGEINATLTPTQLAPVQGGSRWRLRWHSPSGSPQIPLCGHFIRRTA